MEGGGGNMNPYKNDGDARRHALGVEIPGLSLI